MSVDPTPGEVEGSSRVQQARAEERRLVRMERDIASILEHDERTDKTGEELARRHENMMQEIGVVKTILIEHVNQVRDRREYERLVELEDRVRALQIEKTNRFAISEEDAKREKRREQLSHMLGDAARFFATLIGLYIVLNPPHF